MTNVGDKAPDFELKDQHDEAVSLSDHNDGKVLLAFFPFAFSPVCTEEMKCFIKGYNTATSHFNKTRNPGKHA